MKLILLFVGFTVGTFIVCFVIHFVMNFLRMILMTIYVTRRLDDAEKTIYDVGDSSASEAARIATFDPGTPWFPSWLPLPLKAVWCTGGIVTVIIRYAFRAWWPILMLAAALTAIATPGGSHVT